MFAGCLGPIKPRPFLSLARQFPYWTFTRSSASGEKDSRCLRFYPGVNRTGVGSTRETTLPHPGSAFGAGSVSVYQWSVLKLRFWQAPHIYIVMGLPTCLDLRTHLIISAKAHLEPASYIEYNKSLIADLMTRVKVAAKADVRYRWGCMRSDGTPKCLLP
jgi:hypothetical protein